MKLLNLFTDKSQENAAISAARSFFHRVLQMRRNFLTMCIQKSTQGEKLQADAALCGRSMVEMLGVLAIIGVLSVGAISGYQKAMMKYKLNKFSLSFNTLLNNAMQNIKTFGYQADGDSQYYTDILEKLGLLPEGFIVVDDRVLKEKFFQNDVWVYAYPAIYGIGMGIQGDYSGEVCKAVVNVTKENAQDLYRIYADQRIEISGNFTPLSMLYGNQYCNGQDKKCLHGATISDIETLCLKHKGDETAYRFYISWY